MPEFVIAVTFSYGYTEHRCAMNARHARRIMGGLRGRYGGITLRVHRIGATEDVTADFVKEA